MGVLISIAIKAKAKPGGGGGVNSCGHGSPRKSYDGDYKRDVHRAIGVGFPPGQNCVSCYARDGCHKDAVRSRSFRDASLRQTMFELDSRNMSKKCKIPTTPTASNIVIQHRIKSY